MSFSAVEQWSRVIIVPVTCDHRFVTRDHFSVHAWSLYPQLMSLFIKFKENYQININKLIFSFLRERMCVVFRVIRDEEISVLLQKLLFVFVSAWRLSYCKVIMVVTGDPLFQSWVTLSSKTTIFTLLQQISRQSALLSFVFTQKSPPGSVHPSVISNIQNKIIQQSN